MPLLFWVGGHGFSGVAVYYHTLFLVCLARILGLNSQVLPAYTMVLDLTRHVRYTGAQAIPCPVFIANHSSPSRHTYSCPSHIPFSSTFHFISGSHISTQVPNQVPSVRVVSTYPETLSLRSNLNPRYSSTLSFLRMPHPSGRGPRCSKPPLSGSAHDGRWRGPLCSCTGPAPMPLPSGGSSAHPGTDRRKETASSCLSCRGWQQGGKRGRRRWYKLGWCDGDGCVDPRGRRRPVSVPGGVHHAQRWVVVIF